MSRLLGKGLRACLVCVIITVLWKTALANDCNIGFLSTGWISPPGDLQIEKGKPWEMFCVLNTSHPDGQGGSWRNLSFYIDNKLAHEPTVKKYNETAIRLYVPVSEVSPNSPPHDYYGVTCKQNHVTGICVRHVYVGYPPQEVKDFQCTSYNWERLECIWQEPYNPIETTYALSYQVSLRSSPCPEYRTLAKKNGQRTRSCVYSLDSRPLYRNSLRNYSFVFDMANAVPPTLPVKQHIAAIDIDAHMIPNRMENLNQTEATPSSAKITWKVPFNLQLFPPGLEFRIAYHIQASWVDTTVFHNVPETESLKWTNKSVKYDLAIRLPYANTKYNLSIWARSRAADPNDERFWSQAAMLIVKTSADRPCSGPETSLGSFEVINNRLDMRSATIRWSQLPSDCENGPETGYEITMLDSQRNTIESKNVSSVETTNAVFNNLTRDRAYGFVLQSYNDVGYSPTSSQVFIPMAANMPTAPENVMRIAYNETFFGIQWTASVPSKGLSMAAFGRARSDDSLSYPRTLSNYTVFWCRSVRDSPVQCEGQLYTQEVSASDTSLNVTVPDPRANYQFAVAANQGSYSSGMVWSTCIVIANGNGSQVKQVEVVAATSSSLDVSWLLPCSVQNGIINAFNLYYCPVEDGDNYGEEEPDCQSNPDPIKVPPTVNRYVIGQLEPFTVYKIVMSVETQFGEGQSSVPIMNRTAEGKPSVPLDLNLIEVTNRSLSITWRAPMSPNGASTYYQVFRSNDTNVWATTEKTTATMDVESYSGYVISVQACNSPNNSPKLCSDLSESVSVKTQIGVPGAPGQPSVKTSADNSSCIEIKWLPPTKLAGPTYMSVINITGGENKHNFSTYGNATERLVETSAVCQPGLELKVHVKTVNQAENGELLESPWSVEGVYQCKPEGLSIAQILGITFGAALLVVIIVTVMFIGRRVQVQKTKAREAEIVLPWEKAGNSEISNSDNAKQVVGHQKDVAGLGFNSVPNYYGRLDHKTNRIGGSPPVIDMKKIQTSNSTNVTKEVDSIADRESRSSGHSSGPDSLSWHRNSRSELSSSDSGAELEAPNSPSPDVFVNPPLDLFAKPLAITRSSQNVADVSLRGDMDGVQYSVVQLRDAQRNGTSVPDLNQQLPNAYVCVGMAPAATLAPAQSVGYVTLGPNQSPDSSPSSLNASPNLSVGSNESLIVKSERDLRPAVKIVPLKRNSGGGSSGGYVEACTIEPASDLLASSTPGYVAFKNQEPVELERPAISSATSPPQTNGYVTLGSSVAATAPASSSTHYVQMGTQSNHSLNYV
ncbi:cytokine receptor isoform X2 [Daphnia magna]|uniref:Cytokine receptor n=1 Tax=Daphnia magna TaxID=35525 RepID=A0A0P5VNI4_9CRUS|nr:cytokine receptor isoform X2 [Daphnia magna]KAK4036667.1 hypothetical protein OUZ56_028710 [Daphnia magna]